MRSASTGMQHFPNRGAYGFDVYIGSGKNRQYRGNMMQMMTDPHGFEDTVTLPEGENEVMIELPLYGGISELLIGFPEGATVSKAPDRAIAPVAFVRLIDNSRRMRLTSRKYVFQHNLP